VTEHLKKPLGVEAGFGRSPSLKRKR